MSGFQWRMPVDVRFGAGCSQKLGHDLGERSCIVLAFEQAESLGLRQDWIRLLGKRMLAWLPVPDGLSTVQRARELAPVLWEQLEIHPDAVVVGLGGGTVLDLAKLLRCRPQDHAFEAVAAALRSSSHWPRLVRAPLWLVPTTAGTGSEVTRWATLWDTDHGIAVKRSFDEDFGWADRAYVDPALTCSCPASVTRDTALDALAHALEAIWNVNANPVSDRLALTAARQVIGTLPDALREPTDLSLRCELSLAALNAGLAFSQTRTALAHSLSYAVTLEQGLPHGHACALWLPVTWRLALGASARVDRRLGDVFRCEPDDGAAVLESWLASVGVDASLTAHAIHDAPQRIAAALASERGRNFIGARVQAEREAA